MKNGGSLVAALRGPSEVKTLLKTGSYSIYNEFLHWILIRVSKIVWHLDEWGCINFQASWTTRRVIGVRNAPRKQYQTNLKKILSLATVVLTQYLREYEQTEWLLGRKNRYPWIFELMCPSWRNGVQWNLKMLFICLTVIWGEVSLCSQNSLLLSLEAHLGKHLWLEPLPPIYSSLPPWTLALPVIRLDLAALPRSSNSTYLKHFWSGRELVIHVAYIILRCTLLRWVVSEWKLPVLVVEK